MRFEANETMQLIGQLSLGEIMNEETLAGVKDIISANKPGLPTSINLNLATDAFQYGYIVGRQSKDPGWCERLTGEKKLLVDMLEKIEDERFIRQMYTLAYLHIQKADGRQAVKG